MLAQLLSTDSERLLGAFQFTNGPVKKLEAGKNTLKYLPAALTVNGTLLMSTPMVADEYIMKSRF